MSHAFDLRKLRDRQNRVEAALDRVQGFAATHEEMRRMGELRAQHRQLFADLEMSVPELRADESYHRYHCRLLSKLQPCSREFGDAPLRDLIGAGFEPIADQIVRDATRIARDPTIGSIKNPGALRRITRADQAGNEIIEWRGNPLSWMTQFMSPVVTTVVGFGDGHRLYHLK